MRLCTPATPPLQRVALIKVPEKHANKASAEWSEKGRDGGGRKLALDLIKGLIFP